MTDMVNMTKAEILDIWKGFVRNMTDQGAVVPFAHEIARRVRGELLDRLEVAEKERELWAVIRDGIITPDHLDAGKIVSTKLPLSEMVAITNRLEAAEKERDEAELMSLALRAKIEQMERQEPVAWLHETRRDSDVVTDAVKHVWGKVAVGAMAAYSIPLYALPVAQTQGEEK